MQLTNISQILSGYISRGKIEARRNGSHFLLQARDVATHKLDYRSDDLIRFAPDLSAKDRFLEEGDILFMARGAHNFSVLLQNIPNPTLAAACFFIIRTTDERVLPKYLCWYLNQPPVEQYLNLYSGKGVHMPVVRRAVLEGIDIPLPSVEMQDTISTLSSLQHQEQELSDRLLNNRKKLITAACLQAIQGKWTTMEKI